jgi:hypothetical protein
LNAVTYAAAPFLVETSENGGDDLHTRLAVYGTGFRNATKVRAQATGLSGSTGSAVVQLAVEYAGPAPGYFGLDQLNLVLPPELDGAGAVSLAVSADSGSANGSANVVTFQMGSLPANALRVAGITLSSAFVNAGDSVTATISLNGTARTGGFTVNLRSSTSAVQIPSAITIPVGKVSAQITIATAAPASPQAVTITAQAGSAAQTATLQIDAANTVRLAGFSVTPSTILGGRALSATTTPTGSAPPGGVSIQLSSDNGAAQPPSTAAVPFNTSSVTFSIPTSGVTSSQTVTITATAGGISKTAQVTLVPQVQITLAAASVIGGNSVNASVTLGEAAPAGGANILIQTSDQATAKPPSSIAIPPAQTTGAFTITTTQVTSAKTVSIGVTYAGVTQTAALRVNPQSAVSLSSLTITPDRVVGGAGTNATLTLTGLAGFGGAFVTLKSSSVLAAQVPQFVTIAQGLTSASFPIGTTRVLQTVIVTISATFGGVTKSANLTVQ